MKLREFLLGAVVASIVVILLPLKVVVGLVLAGQLLELGGGLRQWWKSRRES